MRQEGPWLGIDTAGDMASIALCDAHDVLGERSWRSRRRHTRELAPAVAALLGGAGIQPADLSGVAVAIGPGSYTGLRIGLSFAKGIVAVTACPLVGVPTLHALAAPLLPPHVPAGPPLWALLGAGRGRFVAARYEGDGTNWPDPASLPVRRPDDLAALLDPGDRVVGEVDSALGEMLSTAGAVILAPPAAQRRASWLTWLGRERVAAGAPDDPALLEPVYPGGAP